MTMAKWMRKISWLTIALVLLALLLVPAGCHEESPTEQRASVTLTGKVQVTAPGTSMLVPLAGAAVSLDSTTQAARVQLTDSSGLFSFDRIAVGPHELRISHPRIPTIDTVVDVSWAPEMLSLVPPVDVTEIFPLAVGARWVYDYKGEYEYEHFGHIIANWQKGVITFTVVGNNQLPGLTSWTIREEYHFVRSDSEWYSGREGPLSYVWPDTSFEQTVTFAMNEEYTGLHSLATGDSILMWRSPVPFGPKLTRFAVGKLDNYPVSGGQRVFGGVSSYSLLFQPNVGLVRYQKNESYGLETHQYWKSWGTLLDYTPGQGAR